jgi:hypothetical protein
VHPKLKAIIEATPPVGLKTFLVTFFGKAYTAPGFGNWFRKDAPGTACGVYYAHLRQRREE